MKLPEAEYARLARSHTTAEDHGKCQQRIAWSTAEHSVPRVDVEDAAHDYRARAVYGAAGSLGTVYGLVFTRGIHVPKGAAVGCRICARRSRLI